MAADRYRRRLEAHGQLATPVRGAVGARYRSTSNGRGSIASHAHGSSSVPW